MGLIDFVKDAGEKLGLGKKEKKDDKAEEFQELRKGNVLMQRVMGLGLKVDDLKITYDDGVATVNGKAESQAEREKIVLAVGNTEGVARVDDRLQVVKPEPEAVFHTVERGDSLSKIAKAHYGDAMKYPLIFEANKPMLADPDKIYPGQVLRIPPMP
jgi:nucleoid-associated protein YgaU